MLLGSFALGVDYVQVIPPDGEEHTAPIDYNLQIPAGTTLAQDDTGTGAITVATAWNLRTMAPNTQLWAKGTGTLLVIGAEQSGG